jgi:hypothetical protein
MAVDESKPRIDTITELRARIEHSLHTRTAQRGTLRGRLEGLVKTESGKLWGQLKKRPLLGVLLVSGAGLALATAIGVGELTIGALAGYAAFQVLREGVPPAVAAEDLAKAVEKL